MLKGTDYHKHFGGENLPCVRKQNLIRVNTTEMVLVCATVSEKGKLTTEVRGVKTALEWANFLCLLFLQVSLSYIQVLHPNYFEKYF